MTATSGRTYLCLFLALSLTAALWIGLQAWHSGVAARANTATMQLQSDPETDHAARVSDTEGDKTAACARRDYLQCAMVKHGIALGWPDGPVTHDGKTAMAPIAEIQPKQD